MNRRNSNFGHRRQLAALGLAAIAGVVGFVPTAWANITTDTPTASWCTAGGCTATNFWNGFDVGSTGFKAWYFGSQPIRDAQNFGGDKDASNGGASFSAEAEISSGGNNTFGSPNFAVDTNCNPYVNTKHRCGTYTSAFFVYYDGGTLWNGVYGSSSMLDDWAGFRMRIASTPDTNSVGLLSNHWNFLLDLDGDGYKEFWIDVDGKPAGLSDTIHIYYEDAARQDITTTVAPVLREDFPGCAKRDFASAPCTRSYSRTRPVTDYDPTDTTGDWFVDVAVPLWAMTEDSSAIATGGTCPKTGLPKPAPTIFPGRSVADSDTCYVLLPSTAYGAVFSTSDSSTDPLQKDFTPGCGATVAATCTFGTPVPVTLAYVSSVAHGTTYDVRWVTATENRNAAFRVFDDPKGDIPLSSQFVPSLAVNSAEPLEYSVRLERAPSTGRFWLADYDIHGARQIRGPFAVGRDYGQNPRSELIDWPAVTRANLAANAAQAQTALNDGLTLWVKQRGVHRVGYEELAAAGVDLAGTALADLRLSTNGASVRRRVISSDAVFGAGDAIEFFAEPIDSLYSAETPYWLEVRAGGGTPTPISDLPAADSAPAWSWGQSRHALKTRYNFASPDADPWGGEQIFASTGTPVGVDIVLDSSARAAVPGVSARLSARVIGVIDWAGDAPDHHVNLMFNGAPKASLFGDGLRALEAVDIGLDMPADNNTVRVELGADTAYAFDMVNVDYVALDYPRLPAVENGRWLADAVQFGTVTNAPPAQALVAGGDRMFANSLEDAIATNGAAASLLVTGLGSSEAVAYRNDGSGWAMLADTRVAAFGGGFAAWVPSTGSHSAAYFVADATALSKPRLEPRIAPVDIQTGAADYLIITNPAFTSSLGELVALKQGQGLSTSIVETTQIFRQFGFGLPDAASIGRYIAYAVARRGVRYVLLVGGDTYDYKNYTGAGSLSFVPTNYMQLEEVVRFAPSDTHYADVDKDGAPDVAIGRLPVRTAAELGAVIAKIVTYSQPDASAPHAILVADGIDSGVSFKDISDSIAAALPVGRAFDRVYVDDLGAVAARTNLLSLLNSGPGLVSFVGHSAPSQWTFDPILRATDIATLTNDGRPSFYLEWGCWNTFFVSPAANTMGHALLLAPNKGGAAAFGATALSDVSAHRELSSRLAPRLTIGVRIGDAILEAKRQLQLDTPGQPDAVLGIELLGDPAMPLR